MQRAGIALAGSIGCGVIDHDVDAARFNALKAILFSGMRSALGRLCRSW